MRNMRPVVVSASRPTEAEGTRGQEQGAPIVVYKAMEAKMRTLGGNELVQARTVFAEARHELEVWTDPKKPIFESDYFELIGSVAPNGKARRLSIISKNDVFQNGTKLLLLCGERTGG